MVRLAEIGDIGAVEEIYLAVLDEEDRGRSFAGWRRGIYPTRETAVSAQKRGELFVLDEGGAILACAVINSRQPAEYKNAHWKYAASDGEVMVLNTLAVHPSSKGRGCGRKMVDFYERYGRERGCLVLRMNTQVINMPALAFYKKLGFEEAGVIKRNLHGIPNVKIICLEKKL